MVFICLPAFLPLPVCKEELFPEHEESSPSLVQEEPQPLQIKEEQEELLQEEADGSTLTSLAVKSEGDDKKRDTEVVASTSTFTCTLCNKGFCQTSNLYYKSSYKHI